MEEKKDRLKVFDRGSIKLFVIIFMFIGHTFAWIAKLNNPDTVNPYDVMPFWQQIFSHLSLLCPPVMFFFVGDGYHYTHDRKKYALRLLIFACITQIPAWIFWVPVDGWRTANVIFTLLFGLLEIMLWESRLKKWQKIALIILLIGAGYGVQTDWMVCGDLFILFLYIFRDKPKARFIAYTCIVLFWSSLAIIFGDITDPKQWLDTGLDFAVLMTAYSLRTVFYNGEKGEHPVFTKWFFYIFYPAHYFIILGIYLLTKGAV